MTLKFPILSPHRICDERIIYSSSFSSVDSFAVSCSFVPASTSFFPVVLLCISCHVFCPVFQALPTHLLPVLQGQCLNWNEAFYLFYLHMPWCLVEDILTEVLLFQTKLQQDPRQSCHLHLPDRRYSQLILKVTKQSSLNRVTTSSLTLTLLSMSLISGCLGLISNVFFWLA